MIETVLDEHIATRPVPRSAAQDRRTLRIAHVLRKYDPSQWGGTETAVHRLADGLGRHAVESIFFCPRLRRSVSSDPLAASGHTVKRYDAFIPVAGISDVQRDQLRAIGGNLMSLDLPFQLAREPGLDLIHTHALNRLGGIALRIARLRRVPCVVTVHGGVLDLPASVRESLVKPLEGGFEWGKLFGMLLRSRRLLEEADAIITCNQREAALLNAKHPRKRILVQPHSVPASRYAIDHRDNALHAFPQIAGWRVLLCVGRIDAVKNQQWLLRQLPALLQRIPNALLVFAGACTDSEYGRQLETEVWQLGLEKHVLSTGGLPPGDARLIGLLQLAGAVVLPSRSETFGLVILEAWAAGTPVISSRTSGATELVRHGENGLLFDLDQPETFHGALDAVFGDSQRARAFAQTGRQLVRNEFDSELLAARIRDLYDDLIREKRR